MGHWLRLASTASCCRRERRGYEPRAPGLDATPAAWLRSGRRKENGAWLEPAAPGLAKGFQTSTPRGWCPRAQCGWVGTYRLRCRAAPPSVHVVPAPLVRAISPQGGACLFLEDQRTCSSKPLVGQMGKMLGPWTEVTAEVAATGRAGNGRVRTRHGVVSWWGCCVHPSRSPPSPH